MELADITFADDGSTLIATVTGEIDMSNSQLLRAAIAENTSNHLHAVVLDLTGVTFLDSAGIQLIYSLRENLTVRGQSLHLVIPGSSAAHDALRLAGVLSQVPTTETVEEASP